MEIAKMPLALYYEPLPSEISRAIENNILRHGNTSVLFDDVPPINSSAYNAYVGVFAAKLQLYFAHCPEDFYIVFFSKCWEENTLSNVRRGFRFKDPIIENLLHYSAISKDNHIAKIGFKRFYPSDFISISDAIFTTSANRDYNLMIICTANRNSNEVFVQFNRSNIFLKNKLGMTEINYEQMHQISISRYFLFAGGFDFGRLFLLESKVQ